MSTVRAAVDAACPPFLRGYKLRIEASSLASRLIRGTFWSFVAAVLSRILGLASSIFVARLIGTIGMGKLGIVQNTVGMFGALAGLGLGLAATKHIAQYRIKDPLATGQIIACLSLLSSLSGAILTLVIVVMAPWLASHTLGSPELAPELRLGSLLLFFGVANGVQTGVLAGLEAFKQIAKINLASGLIGFFATIGGAYFWGLPGVIFGQVVCLAANCAFNFYVARQETVGSGIIITFRNIRRHSSLLWEFGLPGMLAGLISGPVVWITSLTLVRQPGSYSEMGIYNATTGWFQAVAFLPDLVSRVLLPILSSCVAAKDNRGMKRARMLATGANLAVTLPIIAGCSLLSPFIMGLYGPGFARGWLVMVLSMFTAGLLALQGPFANQLIANARVWAYFWAHVGWGIVFLVGTFLLVPAYGATGLATARLIGTAIGFGVIVLAWYTEPETGSPSTLDE